MINPSTPMPIVIIFERHWDVAPKKMIQNLIPKLADLGYNTLCNETPAEWSEQNILEAHKRGLESHKEIYSQTVQELKKKRVKTDELSDIGFEKLANIIRIYVSSKQYIKGATQIKDLPATTLLKEVFSLAQRSLYHIKGVDIKGDQYEKMLSPENPTNRMGAIDKNEVKRIDSFSENLMKLSREGKNILFFCGALHAENLMNKFKEKGIADRVLYYFPHVNKNYDDNYDDIKELFSNSILRDHTFCLTNENQHQSLVSKILNDIKFVNAYKRENIKENSHALFLSNLFKADFKAFERHGHYVDVLMKINDIFETIKIARKCEKVNIQPGKVTLEDIDYLVIRDVNTKEVADQIRQLK